ncbi:hypothetical protein BD410DRAFT_832885 [Rickenella mellea]|uniref:Uncharacterized protein n=1 Tax=Rickenella mellea TaxID=50990 RepID=A0A4Y7PIN1_9AGAM|nr:hypothetical protein BD410DRAFT_832885 [Rickenella mellea]
MDIKSETSPSSSTQPQSRAPALSVSQLFIPPVLPPKILSVKFEIARKESVATSFFRYTPHNDTIPYDLDRADVLDRFYAFLGLPPSITQLGWRLSHEPKKPDQVVLHVYNTTPTADTIYRRHLNKVTRLEREERANRRRRMPLGMSGTANLETPGDDVEEGEDNIKLPRRSLRIHQRQIGTDS